MPVGQFESDVPERLYLGVAAPGPGRARRGATPGRDAGGSQRNYTSTGLVAPAFDGFIMGYHRPSLIARRDGRRKMEYRSLRYFIE